MDITCKGIRSDWGNTQWYYEDLTVIMYVAIKKDVIGTPLSLLHISITVYS